MNTINERLFALKSEIAQRESDLISAIALQGEDHQAVLTGQKALKKLKNKLEEETKKLIDLGISVADPIEYRQSLMDTLLNISAQEALYVSKSKELEKVVKKYSLEGKRSLALSWDGYSDLIAGTVEFNEADYKGILNLALPNNDGTCEGSYSLQADGKGTWQISCTNNMGAAGTLKWIKDGGVTGIGRDHNDKKVKFTVSKQS